MEIKSPTEYRAALVEMRCLMRDDPPPVSDAGRRLEALIVAVEAYETKAYPMDAPAADDATTPPYDSGTPPHGRAGHWNYRVVAWRNGEGYGLHEVYYDANGQPWGMTEQPATFATDDADAGRPDSIDPVSQLTIVLSRAIIDANRAPILDEPEPGEWPGKNPSDDDDDPPK